MLLAFRPRIGNQSSGIETFGLPKYGTCDVNRIVKGKFVDDVDGCIVGASKSLCELGAGRYFDVLLEPPYYLAKHPDFVIGIAAGYQYIGRIPQRSLAAFGRSP
jgi:hypothetical protein